MPDSTTSNRPTVLITGASSGVGLHSLVPLDARGWRMLLACRDLDKARSEARRMGIDPEAHEFVRVDLSAQGSVRACAEAVLERASRLDSPRRPDRPRATRSASPRIISATFS